MPLQGRPRSQSAAFVNDDLMLRLRRPNGGWALEDRTGYTFVKREGQETTQWVSLGYSSPLKWSALRYCFRAKEDHDAAEETQAGGDRCELRQVDVLVSQGQSVADAVRSIGVTEVTYYRWRQEFGGLKSDQVKRLKDLETENTRLRRAIADLTLDKLILQEAARGNF